MFNGNLGLDYYFLDGPLTPFVSGGIGFSYFDSGVPSGSPDVICWWDPWWGYICSGSTPTHDDWSFNWKGGVGLRLDLENGMLIKLAYNVRWAKIGAAGTEAFPEVAANVGWKW
jgi:opacity protein-like surface antigen